MKSLLILALTVFSLNTFAEVEYSCDMHPGQQGGHYLIVRIAGSKAKVSIISPSEQNAQERYLTTLHQVSKKNSRFKHYVEDKKDGKEFFIRRGAGVIGRTHHHTNEFGFYSCSN